MTIPSLLICIAALVPTSACHNEPTSSSQQEPAGEQALRSDEQEFPFGPGFSRLEVHATGKWWQKQGNREPALMVDRDQVLAFALYTHDQGVLKLTAQLYPLLPDESRTVRLELLQNGSWQQIDTAQVVELGWSAHFRIENWDSSRSVSYRVRHGESASFEGKIRRDPVDRDTIVVGTLSCNSSRTPGSRETIVGNLRRLDPDLLFFAGDQSYHHTEHTFGWLEFGVQFREVLKDRPVVTIPDDHDVGQSNIWGEGGKKAASERGTSGGYYYPPQYVNMVQRCQTWHLPDPFDATPVERGIEVYYTRLRVGGIDFAIIEDRKFKSGPEGKIPQMGPRPDHIDQADYDSRKVDIDGLVLLGRRQLDFLRQWGQDWTGTEMKCVLSQTAFCGAVHLHGAPGNRLLADLDCNGWPQSARDKALAEIRRCWAIHLCGDQHLSVFVKHGIENFGDGPYAFTSPAIVNTVYGRWWHPKNEQPGGNPIKATPPLKWTGDYEDGLGNKITMMAYANPGNIANEKQRADGFGIVRFNKRSRSITSECWHRFANLDDNRQFPGWPITVNMSDNDGRKVTGYLPMFEISGVDRPVIQVIEESSNEILYTVRADSNRFQPRVYRPGKYTIRIGKHKPDQQTFRSIVAGADKGSRTISANLSD